VGLDNAVTGINTLDFHPHNASLHRILLHAKNLLRLQIPHLPSLYNLSVILIVATVARSRYLFDVGSQAEDFRVDIFGETLGTFRKFELKSGLVGKIFYVANAIVVIAAALLSLFTGFGGTVMQMSGKLNNVSPSSSKFLSMLILTCMSTRKLQKRYFSNHMVQHKQ
jgi:hypothetical protein